jgi:hypothetical protein
MATPQLAMRAKPSATNNVAVPNSLATNSRTNTSYACAINVPQVGNSFVGSGSSMEAAISNSGCTANCTDEIQCIQDGCAAYGFNSASTAAGLGVSSGLGQQSMQDAIRYALDDCTNQGLECTYTNGICSNYCA